MVDPEEEQEVPHTGKRKWLKVSSDIHIIHIFFHFFVMNNSGENVLKYQSSKTRPLGYKTVFMISSIEHKYSTAQ